MLIILILQGIVQDLLYVPVDFAAYEHCTKYCPECHVAFPVYDTYYHVAEVNDTYGAAYGEEGVEIGYTDKKMGGVVYGGKVEGETVFVSINFCVSTILYHRYFDLKWIKA